MREYRLTWEREGRRPTRKIYQHEGRARAKAERILALELVKDGTRFADMPDLVAPPVLESREVSEWTPDEQPLDDQPGPRIVHEMRFWARPEPDHAGVF